MDTTQSINLLKNEKASLDGKASALSIAVGVLEETLEFQSNELRDQYESTIDNQLDTISGLESAKSDLESEIDSLNGSVSSLESEKEAWLIERADLIAQIDALSNPEIPEA